MSVQGLVWREAWRWRQCRDHVEDLAQEAMLWVMKAAERFDPSRGLKFTTLASHYIKGAMRRHAADGCRSPVTAGRSRAERHGFWRGTFKHPAGVSIDAPAFHDSTTTLSDTLRDGTPSPEDQLGDAQSRDERRRRVRRALNRLDPRERAVVEQRLMSDKEDVATLLELGNQLTTEQRRTKKHLSSSRIRQIERIAIDKLKRALVEDA